MPDTNGGAPNGVPKYSVVISEPTGEVLGNMNLATGFYLAHVHSLIARHGLDKELDTILDKLDLRIEQDPRFNRGHGKDLNVLRIYREHCPVGLWSTPAPEQVPAPQPPPPATPLRFTLDNAPSDVEGLMNIGRFRLKELIMPFYTTPEERAQLHTIPVREMAEIAARKVAEHRSRQQPPGAGGEVQYTLADALRSRQEETAYRRWANDVGEDLVKERLHFMAAHPEKSHPPMLELVPLVTGGTVLLAPSATRYISGQLLTVSFAINGEVPKGRRSKDMMMDGDGNPFIRSLQSPAAGLEVGESVWMRVLRANEGSKIRYWVHHEDLEEDLEDMYLYYVIRNGSIVQLSQEEWRS